MWGPLPLEAKSWRPSHALTPSCILPWPAAQLSSLCIVLVVIVLACRSTAPFRTFLLSWAIVAFSDLLKCGSSGCSLPWISGPFLSSYSGESEWMEVTEDGFNVLSFRTPTARRWRSGRRTTPSSRMSTTCATPRWPSGWRMLKRSVFCSKHTQLNSTIIHISYLKTLTQLSNLLIILCIWTELLLLLSLTFAHQISM